MGGDRCRGHRVSGAGNPAGTPEDGTSQEKVKLFTHMAVREDAITLYGFLHQSELEMFRILIGVSGIGPQTAMNLLIPDRDRGFRHRDPE